MARRASLDERFLEKCAPPDQNGCVRWLGATRGQSKHGRYGYLRIGPAKANHIGAHVYAWVRKNGPVPEGLEIHHRCERPWCVNHEHLEPLTHAENIRRQAETITHCPQGHEYTPKNMINGRRDCRECSRQRDAARYQRKKKERSV